MFEQQGNVMNALSAPVLSAGQGNHQSLTPKIQGPSVRPSVLKTYSPGSVDIFLLGLAIVLSGQYVNWNIGLSTGLTSYAIACVVMGSAYVVFCSCLAEITGALPFAGGAYGLTRCTLGYYTGFLIGYCETLEYSVCVATGAIYMGQVLIDCMPSLDGSQPLIWAVFYATALVFHIRGDRPFWVLNAILGVLSLVILLLFCFGSLPHINFHKYALEDKLATTNGGFVDGFEGFLKALPLAAWFLLGIETLNLASDQVERPTAVIPKAQMYSAMTLVVTGALVFFVAVSLPPGLSALPQEFITFNRGFMIMFDISSTTAAILSLPSAYASAFVYIWCYSKLISAMAMSKLLPSVLGATSRYGTPHMAILVGSAVSYVMSVVIYYGGLIDYTFMTCIACAFLTYIAQCISYISLRCNYQNMASSTYRSPFGIPGAVYAICVWVLSLVSIAGFQGNHACEILTVVALAVPLTVVYFVYAWKRQVLSQQEKQVLLVARDLV